MFCERVCLRLKLRKEPCRCVFPPTRSKICFPAFTPERSDRCADVPGMPAGTYRWLPAG